jgi:hypothetical protein
VSLESSIKRAEDDRRAIWDAIPGQIISLGDKSTLLLAYLAVALEHYEAIVLLARSGLFGSALALTRSVYEIMWHAAWSNAYSSPGQIKKILKGKFKFPEARDVVKDLDRAYNSDKFFQTVHKTTWKHLNSYTHTGKNQLLSRMIGTDVTPNYTAGEKRFVLDSTRTAAAMTAILVLKAHRRDAEASKVEQILLAK